VLDLAEAAAWAGSPFVSEAPQRVQALHAAAIQWLEDVAAGRIPLPASSPPAGPTAESDAPQYTAPPRTFTAEELDGL
jgi:hypothetical protein